jgi:hypothetical protein
MQAARVSLELLREKAMQERMAEMHATVLRLSQVGLADRLTWVSLGKRCSRRKCMFALAGE